MGSPSPGTASSTFPASGPASRSLVSKTFFSSGTFTMPFLDYRCDNTAPAGRGSGSIAGFGLGDKGAGVWVRFERGQIGPDLRHGITGGYLEVNWVVPGEPGNPIHVNWLQSEIAAGFLRIQYDRTRVSFFYRATPDDEWTQMVRTGRQGQPILVDGQRQPLVLTPGWTTAVPLFINALPGGSRSDRYTLSFKTGSVEASPMTDGSPGK